MSGKFQNKYRIPSARASWWDYGSNAAYFVTICTRNREHFFGEIVETMPSPTVFEMQLTPIGQSAYDCWNEIPKHFPFVVLDEFVVMPNHVHGIIVIDKPEIKNKNGGETRDAIGDTIGDAIVETQNFASLQQSMDSTIKQPKTQNKFGPQSQNLASIIRGFKIGVTKFAR